MSRFEGESVNSLPAQTLRLKFLLSVSKLLLACFSWSQIHRRKIGEGLGKLLGLNAVPARQEGSGHCR
jgi:hypothetical protein